MKLHHIENINYALSLFKADGVTVIGLDALDIFNGNISCINGLIWALILRYQLSPSFSVKVLTIDLSNANFEYVVLLLVGKID